MRRLDPATLPSVIEHCGLTGLLEAMQDLGSSVELNYGEDTGMWEASWIVGGERFTAVRSEPDEAARDCARIVVTETMLDRMPLRPTPGDSEASE